ncbi:helix-turn-helix domain-containing protein [Clavibacter sp. MX14-G9D]|uniref:helix-turn-helix domain-containing protein n=1 Tax=Clavibacter sp. MX14-G9D TaxID=3064656 RepID=UPI00293F78CD|nr:helix-turn-helix domain-containing protein [Clavibacter sp. MX14-G9D]
MDQRRVEMLRLRQEIVTAAGALFARFGYEATTFSRIARAIDRPKSAIGYHLFPSKASLAEAVLGEDDLRWQKADDALARAGISMGVERLLALLVLRAREIDAHPERAGALRLLIELPSLDVDPRGLPRRLLGAGRVRFARTCIEAGLTADLPGRRAEIAAFSDLFLDSTRGLVLCHLALREDERVEPRLCTLWTHLLEGAGVPQAAAVVRRVSASPRIAVIAAQVEDAMAEEEAGVR